MSSHNDQSSAQQALWPPSATSSQESSTQQGSEDQQPTLSVQSTASQPTRSNDRSDPSSTPATALSIRPASVNAPIARYLKPEYWQYPPLDPRIAWVDVRRHPDESFEQAFARLRERNLREVCDGILTCFIDPERFLGPRGEGSLLWVEDAGRIWYVHSQRGGEILQRRCAVRDPAHILEEEMLAKALQGDRLSVHQLDRRDLFWLVTGRERLVAFMDAYDATIGREQLLEERREIAREALQYEQHVNRRRTDLLLPECLARDEQEDCDGMLLETYEAESGPFLPPAALTEEAWEAMRNGTFREEYCRMQ